MKKITLRELRKANDFKITKNHTWECYDPMAQFGHYYEKSYPLEVISNGKTYVSKMTRRYVNTGDREFIWNLKE